MLNIVNKWINGVTMYRLILYYLLFLLAVAAVFCIFGVLPYSIVDLLYSALVITVVCAVTNAVFAYVFRVPANVESAYITALILILIVSPQQPFALEGLGFLFWVSVWAMASKYILAIGRKHIFNPAAFAVVLTAFTINQSASWWIGTLSMVPFVVIGGLIITQKIRRFDLVAGFLIAALVTFAGFSIFQMNPLLAVQKMLFDAPLLFFAFVMITEPLTTPPDKRLRIIYGALTGFLFAPVIHVGSLYSTPELALIAGNVFSYLASPKEKYILMLEEKTKIGKDIYNFLFSTGRKMKFKAGQYLEWTLGHAHPDSRGNRRFFTIASAPSENGVQLGVKFYPDSSSYKKKLLAMEKGDFIIGSQLAGEFVLPDDKQQKVAFIAGGIGITPFRSMIKYLLDNQEKRSIILFYSCRTPEEIVYADVFRRAEKKSDLKTVFTLTDLDSVPSDWTGYQGYFGADIIAREAPDYRERLFYISGPSSMVTAVEKTLRGMGIKRGQIKKDFFPGF